jgi:ABC-type dipeptide/oligopeptide/nickel transport system permease subunit
MELMRAYIISRILLNIPVILLVITLAVLAFNLAGDALRDVLDPRLRV